jgi:hypothetical protein
MIQIWDAHSLILNQLFYYEKHEREHNVDKTTIQTFGITQQLLYINIIYHGISLL